MPPPKRYFGRATIHLKHLPSKKGHHTLECLMTRGKIRMLGTVVFVWGDDGVVSAYFEHVCSVLGGGGAVYGEGVLGVVYGTPVWEGGFEGGFYFPVFD